MSDQSELDYKLGVQAVIRLEIVKGGRKIKLPINKHAHISSLNG